MAQKDFAKVIKTKLGDVLVTKIKDWHRNLAIEVKTINDHNQVKTSKCIVADEEQQELLFRSYEKDDALLFLAQVEDEPEEDFHPDTSID